MLQKRYFMYKKIHVLFSFIISSIFEFFLMNALVYVNIEQGREPSECSIKSALSSWQTAAVIVKSQMVHIPFFMNIIDCDVIFKNIWFACKK